MNQQILRLQGTDNSILQVYEWAPEASPIAGLHILHGKGEHSQRYKGLAEFLVNEGFVVWAHDHRQHGYSLGHHKPGIFDSKDTWEAIVEDVEVVQETFRQSWPDLPMYMLGHSMGSIILRSYVQNHSTDFAGIIVMGTPVTPHNVLVVGQQLAKIFRRFSYFEPSKFLDHLSVGKYNKTIDHPRTSEDWLSVDQGNVDRFIADPLCGYAYNPSFYMELAKGAIEVNQESNMKGFPKVPTLFISGSEDAAGGLGQGVSAVAKAYENNAVETTLILLKGMRHEVLNEVDKELTYQTVLDFMLEQL